MNIISATIFAVLMIVFFFGSTWYVFSAFRAGVHYGILCFIPFGAFWFLIERPKEARAGCLIQLIAIAGFLAMILVGYVVDAIHK